MGTGAFICSRGFVVNKSQLELIWPGIKPLGPAALMLLIMYVLMQSA